MTLQTMPPISILDVCTEKGVPPSTSLVTLCTEDVNPASAVQPSSSAPYSLLSFLGYDHNATFGQLPAPTVSAAWNGSTNVVDVIITPGAGTPAETTITYQVLRRYTGDEAPAIGIGQVSGTGVVTFHDGTATETAFPYAYSAIATADFWDASDPSAEDEALVGA